MKYALLLLILLLATGAGLYLLGPREPVVGEISVDTDAIAENVDTYLYRSEADVPGIVRGAQKHVLWDNPARRVKREWAVVYLHGFSATSHEIRPVPKLVANALEANLYYTRLQGHGRNGEAMREGTVPGWTNDVAEALEVGRAIGEKTLVIATSTGGTLAALAAFDERLRDKIDAIVFVSPNFRLQAQGSALLNQPFSRRLVPLLVGEERFFIPRNEEHGKRWTTRYPSEALVPMAAAIDAANALPFEQTTLPALFIFADADQVVDARRTRAVAARWGGPVALYPIQMENGDDPESHVIAGDIMSPNQNEPVAERILLWLAEL